jgi:hypothetical protein
MFTSARQIALLVVEKWKYKAKSHFSECPKRHLGWCMCAVSSLGFAGDDYYSSNSSMGEDDRSVTAEASVIFRFQVPNSRSKSCKTYRNTIAQFVFVDVTRELLQQRTLLLIKIPFLLGSCSIICKQFSQTQLLHVTFLYYNLKTNSMEHRPYSEVNIRSDNQEINCLLCNLEVHLHAHKSRNTHKLLLVIFPKLLLYLCTPKYPV